MSQHTLSPAPAPTTAAASLLSPEECRRLEEDGLSLAQIRRLVFARWLHATRRLQS
jgi:hypothetical protein